MLTQVSFTTDVNTKKMALEKAKKEGISLKTVLQYSMIAYIEGKIKFGIKTTGEADVEELKFSDKKINEKAAKIAKLLS